MAMLVSLEYDVFVGLIDRDEDRNRIYMKNSEQVFYKIPILYKRFPFNIGYNTKKWFTSQVCSLNKVIDSLNLSLKNSYFAPMLPDLEIATKEDIIKFNKDYFAFLKELLDLSKRVSFEDKKTIKKFISENNSIWSSYLMMLPIDVKEKYNKLADEILI
jgi:hypothetical protein